MVDRSKGPADDDDASGTKKNSSEGGTDRGKRWVIDCMLRMQNMLGPSHLLQHGPPPTLCPVPWQASLPPHTSCNIVESFMYLSPTKKS